MTATATGGQPRAVVTAEFPAAGLAALAARGYAVQHAGWGATGRALDDAELAAVAADAEVLLVEIETVTAATVAALPALRFLGVARGAPVNVDLDAARAAGVTVAATPGRNADSVADYTLAVLLQLVRPLAAAEAHLRTGAWLVDGDLPYQRFRGRELQALRLGLVGRGAIGQRVAQRAAAFGMAVAHHDPAVAGSVPLPDLLAGSDVLSVHCPRGPETAGMLAGAQLRALPPGGYLINTAGGGIVDEAALVAALDDGHLAGAALDVFSTEPLPPDSPLRSAPRLRLTPHVAGAALDVVSHHAGQLLAALDAWRRGSH